MSIQDVSAETLAKLFHHYREALAEDYDGKGSEHGASSWDRTPVRERKLMVAAAQLTLEELGAESADHPCRKYFAKPGEADWGC
jgi:hypothetical protein